ncbi:MAG: mechanosensitive ion channel domain-containing protein, partial [Candidatus Sumerlaeota bacterium]
MIDYLKTELPTLWEVIKNDRFLRIFFGVVIGFPLVFFLSRLTGRIKSKSLSPQNRLLLQKGVLYGGIAILIVMILQQLEYKLTALLGAAGIVGIAVGFAAQAGLSNVISGLFLIVEKPFVVGDIISMGQTFGTVVEIDLLS